MKTIECSVVIDEKRTATLRFPPDVAPGKRHLVVLAGELAGVQADQSVEDLPQEVLRDEEDI